jgi:hypothetical protein
MVCKHYSKNKFKHGGICRQQCRPTCVSVWSRPKGLPIAKQAWPTRKLLLLPSETGCSASSRLSERAILTAFHQALERRKHYQSTTKRTPKEQTAICQQTLPSYLRECVVQAKRVADREAGLAHAQAAAAAAE